jgi:hypothetical protein
LTTFSAGQRLTASGLRSALGLRARKAADTARTTTVTLTADPDLTLSVLANTVYLVKISMLYKGAATNTGDFKLGFSVPSGASLAGGFTGIANPLGVTIIPVTASSTLTSYSNGTGNPLWCMVTATLVTSAAGSLTLTWAQNTSSATATTLMAGSSVEAVSV